MPAPLLVLVDGLGFFAYLSLMIANGIIIKNYGGRYNSFGIAIMLTYNQFPWMVCWYDKHLCSPSFDFVLIFADI